MCHGPKLIEAITEIRKNGGFIFREIDGSGSLQCGRTLPKTTFDRLIEDGLLEASGDSLFDAPSQTYKLKEMQCSEP